MKKLLIALLAVVGFVCLGLAVACKPAKFYKLFFYTAEGASIECEIPSGYEVQSGYTVNFRVVLDASAEGTPVVKANDDVLEDKGEGYYSFKIKSETVVEVSGISMPGNYAIIFDKIDPTDGTEYRVDYNAEYYDNGTAVPINTSLAEGTQLKSGTEVTFSVDVSVYYGDNPEFSVLANNTVLEPDENGKYHTTVKNIVTIYIQDLALEASFTEREDGGSGTINDPFRISRPIDLYMMSVLVSSSFYHDMASTAYYRLENDIDMRGEQVYIIGISTSYYFQGNFDGNNHTISNYYIADTAVDQEEYYEDFMPNLGLFGVAAFAEIYDLNVENVTFDINSAGSEWEESIFYAGSIVGFGMGVNITNCSASGVMYISGAVSNLLNAGVAGGIMGYQTTYYDESTGNYYYSTVRSCSSDMDIIGRSGYIYAAGGIVGYTEPYSATVPAVILNSYSTGDISGAMITGGIAGIVTPYGAVINCYASGYVDAYNRIGNDTDYGDLRNAYSGGIVGQLYYDAIIANCFFTGDALAIAFAGTNYAFSGDIVGRAVNGGANGGQYIETESGLVHNCYSANDNGVTISDNFIKNTLCWSTADWSFSGNGAPVINKTEGSNAFTVTVNLSGAEIDGKDQVEVNITDLYLPMAYWYQIGEYMPQFLVGDNGYRTFGYYFNAGLSEKVPCGFVPTSDITLYVGFADYSDVAGIYYLQWSEKGSGRYIELSGDGTLLYRDGALSCESYYYYTGDYVMLCDTFIAIIDGASDTYTSFKATLSDGVLTIFDNASYPETSPIFAVKEIADFGYGKYYNGNTEYQFNTDGTGVYGANGLNGDNTQEFTYTADVNGGVITINRGGSTYEGVLENGIVCSIEGLQLTAYDIFEGVWKKSAGSHKEYTFDGKGGWSYVYYGYNADGEEVILEEKHGSYTIAAGVLSIDANTKFSFNEYGYLVATDGVAYYNYDGFVGVWNSFATRNGVEITFNGITAQGYGSAVIDYGTTYGSYNVSYEVKNDTVYMYSGDLPIAELEFDEASRTLQGQVFILGTQSYGEVSLYLYDDFRGDWISGTLDITFNGLGNYAISGNSGTLPVSGTVVVNGSPAGSYKLENNTLSGSFEYNNIKYTISYNDSKGTVTVTPASGSAFELQKHDDWYGISLTDGNGSVYTFNGRGNLTGGGTMTVTDGNGGTTSYTYTLSGGMPNVSGKGVLTVTDKNYSLGGTTLYVNTKFTGTWYIAASYGATLVIGNFNAENEAKGTFYGEEFLFTYYPDGNYVTITDPEDPDALPLYINVLEAGDVTELAVSIYNHTLDVYSVCTSGNLDGVQGEYVSDDGTLILDGFTTSIFTDGAAKFVTYEEGEEEVILETYSYTFDEFGHILLVSDDTGLSYLFYENEEGGFVLGGTHYTMSRPTLLYNKIAYGADFDGVEDESIEYIFDGCGTVYRTVGGVETVYSYAILNHDTTLMEVKLELTGNDGKAFECLIDYSTGVIILNRNASLYGVTHDGGVYTFGEENTITLKVGDDETVYTYKVDSHDTQRCIYYLVLTDDMGKKVKYVLDYKGEFFTLSEFSVTAYGENDEIYVFDGLNGVTVTDGDNVTEYYCEVTDSDEDNGLYTIVLTDNSGTETKYILDCSTGEYTMTLIPETDEEEDN